MKTKRLSFKKTVLVLLVVFALIQFLQIDKTNPPVQAEADFITRTHAVAGIAHVLKTSCYDCHSNETTYPWYTNVAPVSWWLRNHISEARQQLNFSEWGTYSSRKSDHKLKECVDMTLEDKMPLWSYTLIHRDAKLSEEQKQALVIFFESQRTYESDKEKR